LWSSGYVHDFDLVLFGWRSEAMANFFVCVWFLVKELSIYERVLSDRGFGTGRTANMLGVFLLQASSDSHVTRDEVLHSHVDKNIPVACSHVAKEI